MGTLFTITKEGAVGAILDMMRAQMDDFQHPPTRWHHVAIGKATLQYQAAVGTELSPVAVLNFSWYLHCMPPHMPPPTTIAVDADHAIVLEWRTDAGVAGFRIGTDGDRGYTLPECGEPECEQRADLVPPPPMVPTDAILERVRTVIEGVAFFVAGPPPEGE